MTCPNCKAKFPDDLGTCPRCGLWISKGGGRKLSALLLFAIVVLPIGYWGFSWISLGVAYGLHPIPIIFGGLIALVSISFAKVAWALWNE